jgi:hypothetical protein
VLGVQAKHLQSKKFGGHDLAKEIEKSILDETIHHTLLVVPTSGVTADLWSQGIVLFSLLSLL